MAANCRFALAVHVFSLLASARGAFTSETLVPRVNTQPLVIRRVLSRRLRAGRMLTRRGPRPGSQLNRAPHFVGRVLGAVFRSADSALEKALAKRNLADVLETVAHDSETSAMQAGVLV
jgi:DNA-binding IscR family transcriptional regulator